MTDQTPPRPPASRAEFWQMEAASKGAGLERARAQIAELQADLKEAQRHFRVAKAQIDALRSLVAGREAEIARLQEPR